MTPTLSSSRALSFFKFSLKKQTPITLLVTAFCLLLCPGLLLTKVSNVNLADYDSYKVPMESYFVTYSLLIFIASLALMLILTLQNFNFLFSKKAGDMFHSLPLSRNELLFVRISSTFIGALFAMTASYTSLGIVNYMPDILPVPFSTLSATYVVMVLMLIMCTVFTALFAVCSGGIFDFIIAIGAVNLGLPAIYAIFTNFIENITYGVRIRLEGIEYMTPFAIGFSGVCEMAENGFEFFKLSFSTPDYYLGFTVLIYWFIITVGSVFLVSRLFAVRRSETAGEAYSFAVMPHIISLLVAICGGYLLGYIFTGDGLEAGGFWLFFIIGIVLCSITAGAIFSRGFKTVKTSLIRSGVALAIAVNLTVVCFFVSGRMESWVPRPEEIKSITVGYNDIVFEKDFDIVTDLHKAAIAQNESGSYYETKESSTFLDQFDSAYIVYDLKSGKTVERNYYGLTDSSYDEYFLRYALSEEYTAQFKRDFSEHSNVSMIYNDYSPDTDGWKSGQMATLSGEKANEILSTYLSELKRADKQLLMTDTCDTMSFRIMIDEYSSTDDLSGIMVPHSFTETQALLSEIGFITESEYYEKYYEK